MEKYFAILRECSLFDEIEDKDLSALLSCLGAKVVLFKKKETIIAEGAPATSIGIVLSGSAQILRMDYFGNRSIVSEAGPSQLFCESFALAGVKEIPVSAMANEDSEIMFLDCDRVLHPCSGGCGFHQTILYNLMKNMALKNILFHQKIEITAKRTTREKLLAYLTLEGKKHGSPSFEIPFDRQELADYLEVDRSGLSAEISKLRKEGIIRSEKSHFTLLQ